MWRLRYGQIQPCHRTREQAVTGDAPAYRAPLRAAPGDATAPVLGGVNGQSIARRIAAGATAAGIARITGHSGRVGLASELTARGASTTETMLAGGWKPLAWSLTTARRNRREGAVAKYL